MATPTRIPLRSEIPIEHTWDLTVIYPDDSAWQQAVEALQGDLAEAAALEGTVAQGPQALLRALEMRDQVFRQMESIHVYASMRKDSDSTDPDAQALTERSGSLLARVKATLAFLEPEILALSDEALHEWQAQEPKLALYDRALYELTRKRPHVRSGEVENIVAQLSDVTRAPGEVFDILTNADLAFPTIEDEAGQAVTLSPGRFLRFMQSPDRRVRADAFHGFYAAYHTVRNTLGMTLAAAIRSHVVNARIRNHASALEAALHPNDIPPAVVHNLVATVDANLPLLHRYMRLRKKTMGLEELRFYDLYAPLVPEADLVVSYPEAKSILQQALAPLGPAYADVLRQAFAERWIDVYENSGKRSGAYSGGAYDTPAFILLNYQDRLNDMFTLAHELGHSAHSYFTRRTQPFVYGDYTIFVAEVASTVNEALLTNYLLNTRQDPALRKHLIVQQLEEIRTTLLRQTMFATFELHIHQSAEQDQPLTTEAMSKPYFDLVARYHGPEVVLDEEMALEWARIPHFYYNFYVYQYATGLSAALALSRQILDEGQPAVDRYLRFLSTGSSRSSIDMLRDAGVDMTTPAPIEQAMRTFGQLLDQLEALS
jgi:oligoendopeptidase F